VREVDESKREALMMKMLRMVAPGTPIREGVDNVLRAKTGGLIVIGYDEQLAALVDGGFAIDCDFTPARLYELAKMDGAIILSEDAKRILYANTQLNPDPMISTSETGTRHRTAERAAIQTGRLVVCVSQRRNVITLYQSDIRYSLKEISVIITKANQAIQTLERYKSVLDAALTSLSALEMEEMVSLQDVANVLQRFEMVMRIKSEIKRYITELGTEGRLIAMQLDELVARVDEEAYLLVKDYLAVGNGLTPHQILSAVHALNSDDLLNTAVIARTLGYSSGGNWAETNVPSRGYRILHKIPRLPQPIIENLTGEFSTLSKIVAASVEELDDVEGIGAIRARAIKDGLRRMQDQVFLERNL
jgi:diadenylate cyclase